jgi:enamine deaminase RidA (YjgF/YER057c/UK114 family)
MEQSRPPGRARVRSGSPFEPVIGFSRAVAVGTRVLVSGTGPVWRDGSCPDDAELQAGRCFEIIGAALAELGAGLDDVIRTRMFLVDRDDADAVSRAHAAAVGSAAPAASMLIIAGLLDPRWKVEIEVEADVSR